MRFEREATAGLSSHRPPDTPGSDESCAIFIAVIRYDLEYLGLGRTSSSCYVTYTTHATYRVTSVPQ
jgi:hypothetical protein